MKAERFKLMVPYRINAEGRIESCPPREVTVEVAVDFEGLANHLVRKAMVNRGRLAVEAGGLVKVKAISV